MNQDAVLPPRRKPLRLPGYDYSEPGWYFITICTHEKWCLFGGIESNKNMDRVSLNKVGWIVRSCWTEIPIHFPNTKLHEYVIMPNHIHGIIEITTDLEISEYTPFARRGDPWIAPTNKMLSSLHVTD